MKPPYFAQSGAHHRGPARRRRPSSAEQATVLQRYPSKMMPYATLEQLRPET